MDHIYAKIKRLQKKPFRKVLSGARIFEKWPPALYACVEYDPVTVLDEGEWFKVSNFSHKDYFLVQLSNWPASADFAELEKRQFLDITYLVAVQNGDFFFQRVRPSAILRRKAIVYGDVAKIDEANVRIVLNHYPDAVYLPKYDTLLFRELAAVSPIFRGIDQLFRTATDEQVSEFLDQKFISTALDIDKVSKPNRKRIALAAETLSVMPDSERSSIFSYMSEYTDKDLHFDFSTGSFKIDTDEELKMLLFGIEQRYYTTAVGAEKRLANSIVKLPK